MTTGTVESGMEDVFSYPLSDPKSPQKLLIAVLLMLANFIIPILPALLLNGYMLEIQRRVVRNSRLELPEWTDWSRYFAEGAKAFLIGFLFMLPVIFLGLTGFALMFLPGTIFGLTSSGESELSPALTIITVVVSLVGLVVLGLMVLLAIAIGFVLPAATTHFVVKEHFAAAFRVGEWWPILRNNISDFLIAYIVLFVIGILSALAMQLLSLTIVLCLLIPFLQSAISVYTMFISAALFARAYRGGLEKLDFENLTTNLETA